MAKLPCSMQRTSRFLFAEGIVLGWHAVGGSIIFLTKIAILGLDTILIAYIGFIGNGGSHNLSRRQRDICTAERRASLSTSTI
jgi:hypothetical protein